MKKIVSFFVLVFIFLASFFFFSHNAAESVFASSTKFYCLGSCPTNIPKVSPLGATPTIQVINSNAGSSKITTQVVHTQQKKRNGFIADFFLFLQSFLNLLFHLLGGGTTPPVPTPTPLPPTPTTALPTPTMVMPSMIMPTASPGAISVADIKYVQGSEPLKVFNLTAEAVGNNWTFNGTVPGPEIRVNQGDHVQINLLNKLPVATSVHWHGLVLPASQDGVPGVTQNAQASGTNYQYNFVAKDAGTYWYHTHQDTLNQLPMGLFGPLIIVPQQETFPTTRDYTVTFRNMSAGQSGSVTPLTALPGETFRIRMINARNGDFSGAPVEAGLIGVPFKVIALDGHEINAPQYIQNQLLPIGMSQRTDVEFTMPATGSVELVEQAKIQTWNLGQGSINNIPSDINTLPEFNYTNYGLPVSDSIVSPNNMYDVNFNLTVGQNLSINGKLFPNVPDLIVHQGQFVHIHIVNNTNMTHPMHLHGHIFTVLNLNGSPITGSPIHLDTVLVRPFTTADIAFQADDPGMWMLHCHVLPHAASGLMMMVRYDNVYTPYSLAPGSGNIPE